jgi:hypothetical protein
MNFADVVSYLFTLFWKSVIIVSNFFYILIICALMLKLRDLVHFEPSNINIFNFPIPISVNLKFLVVHFEIIITKRIIFAKVVQKHFIQLFDIFYPLFLVACFNHLQFIILFLILYFSFNLKLTSYF